MTILNVDDLKAHMNIVGSDDDALIESKIAAAEAWVGAFIGTALDDAEAYPDGPPDPLKEAVRQLVAHLYENREATLVGVGITTVSPGLFDLMAPYRTWVF
ncbi:head-tail connector protein [Frigidibacter oleivorans]|uniref:head-tail connector protein n=1 Tax=Frigidibacter oleivorans TaxID=2487129 RepID=UPI000F8F177D|nr:head-tail connector protein [Frigidibacter oleivorans]